MGTTHADVAVFGATSGGVCAAVAAAEAGASVVLVEPGHHLGGMTSGGLGYTDLGDPRVIGGFAHRFRAAVAEHYRVALGRYAGPEPHVAEAIFARWLEEAGVEVLPETHLAGARMAPGRNGPVIAALETTSARDSVPGDVHAAVYVDASYEGDLLAAAGVPSAVGRESRELYGERFAGRQEFLPGMHTMPPWISPFAADEDGFQEGPLLPQVAPGPPAPVGAGDGGVMSYGYRVCLTRAPDRIPFDRPEDYDEAHWELGRRLFSLWGRSGHLEPAGRMIGLEENLPAGKCDGNSLGPFSLNVLDGSAWEYPTASPDRRDELREHHQRHTRGFLHFLAHDRSVPASIRSAMQSWGWPRDEFADTGHLPHQLYVREARRMLGEDVLTEHDVLDGRPRSDSIAMGSYHIDIREVQRTWSWVHEHPRPRAMVFTEGYLSVPARPYAIGYRNLLPRREHCGNLLVPVCVSASHVAFASLRMEPQYQMLGHAAGLAAALSVREGCEPHELAVDGLQSGLRDAGQILALG